MDEYYFLIYAEIGLLTFMILDKLGRGIVLREIIAFHCVLICLFIPILGFEVYDRFHPMARLWYRFMPTSVEMYYGYALPAVTLFSLGLTFPFKKENSYDVGKLLEDKVDILRKDIDRFSNIGIYMMVFGLIMLYFSNIVPVSMQYIFNLFWLCSFTGFLYVFFSTTLKIKKPLLIGYGAFIIAYSLNLGMFTIFAYMGMLLFSYLFLGKKISFIRKLSLFAAGIFILLLIQSVKPIYRRLTWERAFEGNRVELFSNLIVDQISKGKIFDEKAFFPIYYRANQGYNVSLVMLYIPKYKPYDEGANLGVGILSSFVPRFLWPDKPEAGGKANMRYYTGYVIQGFSTNIGPLGEAYGSFGRGGGIAYMFFLGLFIRFAYYLVFRISKKMPAMILWIPVLFFQVTYSSEADTLQIMNSLIKSSAFVAIIYFAFPKLFLRKEVFDSRKVAIRRHARNQLENAKLTSVKLNVK